jgi:DNA-binding transcriptional MerR regulator
MGLEASMTRSIHIVNAVVVLVTGLLAVSPVGAQSVDETIAEAIRPLPEDLRAGSTVYTYDSDTGARIVLRQGSNHVECHPKNTEGFTRCNPLSTSARRDLEAKLQAEGNSEAEINAALAAAQEAGTIESTPFGSLSYRLYDENDKIRLLWMVRLPNATSGDLGMPIAAQRDPSLAGQGRPWMMREGTPGAHLMIPINGTDLSNPGGSTTRMNTKGVDDIVAQATLPLPEALRAGATVANYDPDTGERQVLREGTNSLECYPRNPATGFTRCYHKVHAAERDLLAKLGAEGRTEEEIQSAVTAGREAGTLAPTPFGSLAYRLYEEDDRLKLLWMVRVPNATSEELGMPIGSQRDTSLAGRGTPWMMLEGTPGAHLMIPINGTELSN